MAHDARLDARARSDREISAQLEVVSVSATCQAFNGERFYRHDGEKRYFRRPGRKGEQYLHRVVWAHHHGPAAPGYDVHHEDGDSANNQIENLRAVTRREHLQHHQRLDPIGRNAARLPGLAVAREAAKAWHRSDEGRAWHRQHAMGPKTRTITSRCRWCGKQFLAAKTGAVLCSGNCATAERYRSGIDNKTRACARCGTAFAANKFAKTRFCGRMCAAAATGDKRRGVRTG